MRGPVSLTQMNWEHWEQWRAGSMRVCPSLTLPFPPHSEWEAPGARGLRGGVSTFLELLGLVLETLESFGGKEGREERQPHPLPSKASPQ